MFGRVFNTPLKLLHKVCFNWKWKVFQVNSDFVFQVFWYNFICSRLALKQSLSYIYIKKINRAVVSLKLKKISPLHLSSSKNCDDNFINNNFLYREFDIFRKLYLVLLFFFAFLVDISYLLCQNIKLIIALPNFTWTFFVHQIKPNVKCDLEATIIPLAMQFSWKIFISTISR